MKSLLIIINCILWQQINAQSLSPGGFASVAGSFTNADAQLDFNFGESVIGSLSNTANMLTNGTLQPDFTSNNIPFTQLRPVDCGKMNLSPDAQIHALAVTGASLYHFEFRDATTGILFGQRITTTNVITPLMVQPALLWNQQYLVRIKAFVAGQWGEFGASCNIGMMQDPAITGLPTISIRPQYCNNPNITLNSNIVCNPIGMGNRYEFKFTNTQNGATHLYLSLTNTCPLPQVIPTLTSGVTYQVQVRGRVYTTWSNYGPICNVTPIAPQAGNKEEIFATNDSTDYSYSDENSITKIASNLITYPNPFEVQTNILMETDLDEPTQFSIYDMQGRLIYKINGFSNQPEILDFNFVAGSYLIRATTNSGIQLTSKILKIN
jgi:hypothetical protein